MRARTPVPTARQLFFPTVPLGPTIQEELERGFFQNVRQRNGTYKYTYKSRLDDLNDLVAGLLPPPRPLRLMDVAVSSGITTLDWVNSLDRLGIEYTMTAGDINLCAYLMSLGRHLNVLVDSSGYPLQYDIFGHAVPNPPARRMLPIYFPWMILLRLVLAYRFEHCRKASRAIDHDDAGSMRRCRLVTLVSPRLIGNDRIQLVEDDILNNQTIRNRYHVVRAANILNRSYFDEPTLVAIVSNLRQRLVEGGLLVVCSTTGDDAATPRPGSRMTLPSSLSAGTIGSRWQAGWVGGQRSRTSFWTCNRPQRNAHEVSIGVKLFPATSGSWSSPCGSPEDRDERSWSGGRPDCSWPRHGSASKDWSWSRRLTKSRPTSPGGWPMNWLYASKDPRPAACKTGRGRAFVLDRYDGDTLAERLERTWFDRPGTIASAIDKY